MVGRLLPFRRKRMVGPFIFIDHMGPARMAPGENLDVAMHPHIGLATLTYLFEGAITHRDSLGTEIDIQPGAVNWMIAGRGAVHTERTPAAWREAEKTLHGLQIWVALPREKEAMEPSFTHVEAEELPHWEAGGAQYKLIAGKLMGHESPVPVLSPTYLLEIKVPEAHTLELGDALYGESALYILEGELESEGHRYAPRQILVARDPQLCQVKAAAGTTFYVFGGEPFPEKRYIEWNFVHSDRQQIEKAKEDWREGRFPAVPGETERIPLP